jgi:hypothetical protein
MIDLDLKDFASKDNLLGFGVGFLGGLIGLVLGAYKCLQ